MPKFNLTEQLNSTRNNVDSDEDFGILLRGLYRRHHPVQFRHGKYRGGVFCRLENNLDCLCTYFPPTIR